MFCMNCGQQLPDGAKFCLNCGTPQGAVSPTGTTQSETINLDGMHTFVPAMCPNCNAHMKVDTTSKVARCDTCGTECLVQDAIKTLTVRGNIQVGNATINVSGTNTDGLLQRVEIMLGDGDFDGAMSKCDTILDSEPTNGRVYFYMLMSNLNCRKRSDLTAQKEPFDGNQYYLKAMQYGDPELKNELQGYINAINAREEEENNAKLKNPKTGDEIYFGTKNGRIWWKILSVRDRMILIISKNNITMNNIASKPYHRPNEKITWAECTLRKWLNSDFINGYFTPAEQSRILPCQLNNDNNPKYKTPGGVPTTDKAFLLSINEANTLFANYQARANGSFWWLRSPGRSPSHAARVSESGWVDTYGDDVISYYGVRPAMWIQLD